MYLIYFLYKKDFINVDQCTDFQVLRNLIQANTAHMNPVAGITEDNQSKNRCQDIIPGTT